MMTTSVMMDCYPQSADAEHSDEIGDQDLSNNKLASGGVRSPERHGQEEQQKAKDGQGRERSRNQFFEDRSDCSKRLFGTLVKRLKMFKQESDEKSDIEKRRRETEARLVEKLNKDKEELFEQAKKRKEEEERQIQLQRHENEKLLAGKAASYKSQYRQNLSNYLITKEKPPIMYKPAVMLPVHKQLLGEHKARINSPSENNSDCSSKHNTEDQEVKSAEKPQESLSMDDHRRSVDMELDEEEWLLSKVPEVICDLHQNSDLEQKK